MIKRPKKIVSFFSDGVRKKNDEGRTVLFVLLNIPWFKRKIMEIKTKKKST